MVKRLRRKASFANSRHAFSVLALGWYVFALQRFCRFAAMYCWPVEGIHHRAFALKSVNVILNGTKPITLCHLPVPRMPFPPCGAAAATQLALVAPSAVNNARADCHRRAPAAIARCFSAIPYQLRTQAAVSITTSALCIEHPPQPVQLSNLRVASTRGEIFQAPPGRCASGGIACSHLRGEARARRHRIITIGDDVRQQLLDRPCCFRHHRRPPT